MQRHHVGAVRVRHHESGPIDFRMALQHRRHLFWMDEHALDLRGLVGTAQPAANARVGAAAGRHARQDRGKVAGTEADQRIVGIETGDHDFADFAVGQHLARAGAHDFENQFFFEHQAFMACGFVGDHAEVGAGVGLVGVDAALGTRLLLRREKGFAGHHGFLQARHIGFQFIGLVEDDLQETRRANITRRPKIGDGLYLHFSLADAGRKDRAAELARRAVDHEAGGREVVGERVVHQFSGAKTGGMERAPEAPPVGRLAFGIVDRPGRGKDAAESGQRRRRQAAEGQPFLLQLKQLVLADHRQTRQIGARLDVARFDGSEMLGVPRRLTPGVGHVCRQSRHQRGLARFWRASFEFVEILAHASHRFLRR